MNTDQKGYPINPTGIKRRLCSAKELEEKTPFQMPLKEVQQAHIQALNPTHQFLQLLGPPSLALLPSAAPPLSLWEAKESQVTPLLGKSSLPALAPHPVALQGSLSRPEASAWHSPGPQGHRTAELSELTSSPNHKCITPQPGYIPSTSNLSLAFIPQSLPECL